ncbi:MAG: hypothetical protein FWG10_05010 [Eubacteriaceae bacterium]|nr:hypothetical protein [Eubacteriaceae bacterium]
MFNFLARNKRALAALLVCVVGLAAFTFYAYAKKPPGWSSSDFVFYNEKGEVVLEWTLKRPFIATVEESDHLETRQGIKIGDDAEEALKTCNFEDFEITFFRKGVAIGDPEITREYVAKIKNVEDLVGFLPEIAEKEYAFKISVTTYKQAGKLVTRSQLKNDGLQPFEKQKYTMSMEIEDNKVCALSFENNYLRELDRCLEINDGVVPDTSDYDWIRKLSIDD